MVRIIQHIAYLSQTRFTLLYPQVCLEPESP